MLRCSDRLGKFRHVVKVRKQDKRRIGLKWGGLVGEGFSAKRLRAS